MLSSGFTLASRDTFDEAAWLLPLLLFLLVASHSYRLIAVVAIETGTLQAGVSGHCSNPTPTTSGKEGPFCGS